MSKSLKLFASAAIPAGVLLVLAANFADRNIVAMPETPDRSEAIAEYTAPPPTPLMAAVAAAGEAGAFGLGRTALPEEIAAWDVDVAPDGTGLPVGAGNAFDGESVFEDNCAICHGSFAEGVDNWPKLAGGEDTLADEDPLKTVGSYWPHLTTAWDYVNRSMPFGNAQSLTADEVYQIVAYILYSNDLIEDDFELNQDNLASFELPNKDGFIIDDRLETEAHFWNAEPCMENCKESVEITMRAAVLDVTPEEEVAEDSAMAEEPMAEEPATETAMADTGDAPADDTPVVEVAVAAADPELVAAGEKVFKKCSSCHQVGDGAKHRTGPHLNGIMGRTAGTADGFKFSNAFKKLAEDGVVWDEETMAAFLADPKGYAKGTRMSFRGLKKDEELAAVSAYLVTFAQ